MPIRVTVYGENIHDQKHPVVQANYPGGMHTVIANALNRDSEIKASTVTLQEPEHGLTEQKLAETDVLFWWGHVGHHEVQDAVVERIAEAVWSGMGAVFLHSAHFSKPFKRLMGTPCNLKWRNNHHLGTPDRERIWQTSRNHPIAAGLPEYFELEGEEMYGEPFGVPEPLETVFISWFSGGEVFRSGLTYKHGAGNIFYFRPGDEVFPTYQDANIQRVLLNAAKWAYNPSPRLSREVTLNAPCCNELIPEARFAAGKEATK
ncbi:glutamine amidotransferase [Cephaloticoccus primus]|uniref:Glutamine amidotransferase n=1 Tax=Cephaloticoccus primus TaxID=1548207 RepID=A0A139SM69_9BACT|nr:ThuA domain-containing protein [Cephaloticoccus primus]KXU35629.1 glutamine amidotransferase [Cephaloticoccus primus]